MIIERPYEACNRGCQIDARIIGLTRLGHSRDPGSLRESSRGPSAVTAPTELTRPYPYWRYIADFQNSSGGMICTHRWWGSKVPPNMCEYLIAEEKGSFGTRYPLNGREVAGQVCLIVCSVDGQRLRDDQVHILLGPPKS